MALFDTEEGRTGGPSSVSFVSFLSNPVEPAIAPTGMKICGGAHGCGKLRDSVKDFAPRWNVCRGHRRTRPYDPACAACLGGSCRRHMLNTPTETCPACLVIPTSASGRQPRCRNCDSLRQEATPKSPPTQGATVTYHRSPNGKQHAVIGACQVMRLVASIYRREERLKAAEDTVKTATAAQLPEAKKRYDSVRKWRDFTAQKVRVYIDHALTVTQYRVKTCTMCDGGRRSPQMSCQDCGGLGTVRVAKTSPAVIDSVQRIEHFKKVLPVTELCAKVAARGSEAEGAFNQLLQSQMGLVRRFRSEKQTALEQDDAEQGAMLGIHDAAIRFSPVKPECYRCYVCGNTKDLHSCAECDGTGEVGEKACRPCHGWGKLTVSNEPCDKCGKKRMTIKTSMANFPTVAYNWAYRNSRARKESDKRAGQVKLGGKRVRSLDVLTTNDDGDASGMAPTGSNDGGLPTTKAEVHYEGGSSRMAMDVRQQLKFIKDERQKTVIELILAGLSVVDIADRMGINKATVSKIRDAAYASLAAGLKAYKDIGRSKELQSVE